MSLPSKLRPFHGVLFASSIVLFLVSSGCATTNGAQMTPETASSTSHQVKNGAYGIDDWWPNRLDLRVLIENAPAGDPMDPDFDYAEAFLELDYEAVKKDIKDTLVASKEWWPADWGHYGGLMIRLAWHSSGTYRATDGRGGATSGTIRFAPLNSWPDNANLDKARRLLWPVKKKYGRSLSWADLMILTGNVAFESMGFDTFGFGGGREDVYEPTDINWGPETEWLADERFSEDGKMLKDVLGATQMGLIYVNPEGPNGVPDPIAAAEHIRIAFGRMGMNDEETVALIAGGHTLGKSHGATRPQGHVGAEPEKAPIEEQGLGWKNSYGTGKGADTITNGIDGAWTQTPTSWSQGYFINLFEHEWQLIEGPGGAHQWEPIYGKEVVPDAHDPNKKQKLMMLTTDLALKEDPIYGAISKKFYENPEEFDLAFSKAWFKLTHRGMGPQVRLLGPEVPPAQLWQDPIPAVDHLLVGATEIGELKKMIMDTGLTTSQLVSTAWASASTYRDTDKRGGANGARILLAPQKDWSVNQSSDISDSLSKLETVQQKFNASRSDGMKISMADLIVLAGNTAIEAAVTKAGFSVEVPFTAGRMDATQEMTDVNSFAYLEPKSDGFQNYLGTYESQEITENLVNHADLLTLTAPEMTVLVGGMRTLGVSHGDADYGVFTDNSDALTNDFFVNLLDMGVVWEKSKSNSQIYEGKDAKTGEVLRTATAADLIFGSNSQLRALAEVYAADDAKEKFAKDFVTAWNKVMMLDRFNLVE